MMFAAQAGRDDAFYEIDRRRPAFAQKMRRAIQDAEQEIADAEFRVIRRRPYNAGAMT